MANPDRPQLGAVPAPVPEQATPFQGALRVFAKEVLDAKNQRMGANRKPVTFADARLAYNRLFGHITMPEEIVIVRGVVRQLPEPERPLAMYPATAEVLRARYRLSHEMFGDEAITSLRDIATGENPGSIDFHNEHVPIVEIIDIARGTFEADIARDITIAAMTARQERLTTPGVGSPQDLEVLEEAVVELPSFQGPKVAETLVGTIVFSYNQNRDSLLRRSAASLRNFSLHPDNALLLSGHRTVLQVLADELSRRGIEAGRRSIEEVLLRIPEETEAAVSDPATSSDPEAVRARLGRLDIGLTQGGRRDTQATVDDSTREFRLDDQGPEDLPRRRPGPSPRDY